MAPVVQTGRRLWKEKQRLAPYRLLSFLVNAKELSISIAGLLLASDLLDSMKSTEAVHLNC